MFTKTLRVLRLCSKELKETLRDRRTIVTLLLMPVLVYPLLSLALQRLILSAYPEENRNEFIIAVDSEKDAQLISETFQLHLAASKVKSPSPIRIQRSESASNQESQNNKPDHPSDHWHIIPTSQNLATVVLAEGQADLFVQVETIQTTDSKKSLPKVSQPLSDLSRQALRFDVQFQEGRGNSEQALMAFRKIVAEINDLQSELLRKEIGISNNPVVQLDAKGLPTEGSLIESLAALVPLVLVLMTITGAVYPAIDLTAGERERGTMESLISTPVSRFLLLFSKYSAVLTVALLTALANLLAMFITLRFSGLGKIILGDSGVPFVALLKILPLLFIFAAFFGAILLALCSIAKSFKEAQAYLIPVMLVSLGPALASLIPGLKLTPTLAILPLINIILLARDTLNGSSASLTAWLAITSTLVYALGMMALATATFDKNVLPQSQDPSFRSWIRRPTEKKRIPRVDHVFAYLAVFFPIYFCVVNMLTPSDTNQVAASLWRNAIATVFLFAILPIGFAIWRRFDLQFTFRIKLTSCSWWSIPGILLMAAGLWTLAHEVFVFTDGLRLKSLLESQKDALLEMKTAFQSVPIVVIWITMAIAPALAEECFFRGFVFRTFERWLTPISAILLSSILFGAFHTISGSQLTLERFLPTLILGIALGWVAWRTGSLVPGILLHALHNGLLFSLAHFEDQLAQMGLTLEDQTHLPLNWIVAGSFAWILGATWVWLATRNRQNQVPTIKTVSPN